jgi:outer membrane murein-binding lipoprotein Lpp
MHKLNKITLLAIVASSVITTGCANRPESIAASYVSHERYMESSCAQLATTMSNARAELATYSDKQDTAANIDAGSVFLVLIPISALQGDSEADVARWKGRVEAIETAQIKKKCTAN